MKTLLTDLSACGIAPFTFAGMRFPKHLWTLPKGSLAKRLKERKDVRCGGYYHAPKPIEHGRDTRGIGFYLDSDGMPSLRWQWADEVSDVRIDHTGWFTDDEGYGDKLRGIVFRLPHGRGFLAGYGYGEEMFATLDYDLFDTEQDAARCADSMAERAAETEREYQAEQDEVMRQEEEDREEEEGWLRSVRQL